MGVYLRHIKMIVHNRFFFMNFAFKRSEEGLVRE